MGDILERVRHPFLVELLWSHQDSSFLYMLFPYVVGGELFTYLRRAGKFSPSSVLFYSAEIVSALDYLHSMGVIYRDLKPENLLLDGEGHLKIIDFGLAKLIMDETWTVCGTPEYLAPEIIQGDGHTKAKSFMGRWSGLSALLPWIPWPGIWHLASWYKILTRGLGISGTVLKISRNTDFSRRLIGRRYPGRSFSHPLCLRLSSMETQETL